MFYAAYAEISFTKYSKSHKNFSDRRLNFVVQRNIFYRRGVQLKNIWYVLVTQRCLFIYH